MPKLVIHPGTAQESYFQLKAGRNLLGRGTDTDLRVDDGSVSSVHCQIRVDGEQTVVTDLGSTNGTFVEDAPVSERTIVSGQTLRLGSVPMRYEAGNLEVLPPPRLQASPNEAGEIRQAPPAGPCKHHPKTRGRYFCPRCELFYCELCVVSRQAGSSTGRTCRHCGDGCVEAALKYERPSERGFFERLPGAFFYPVRGAGVLMLVVGMVLVALVRAGVVLMSLGTIRTIGFGIILEIGVGGYLFSFLQAIVHSTAADEKELPDLPGISNVLEDVIVPFFRGVGLMLFCFVPAIAVAIWMTTGGNAPAAQGALGISLMFGFLYFPMAFLAVAILDSVVSANPLLVVPSIIRVPGKYLVGLLALGAVVGFRVLGDMVLPIIFPEGLSTTSMPLLFAYIGAQLLWGFAALYLLIVATHILGLIYLTSKEELGWI